MNPKVWQGRIDQEDASQGRRIHQQVTPLPKNGNLDGTPVLLGFATDEGVRRNQGRPGAVAGPNAIRQGLANQSCTEEFKLYDKGDIAIENHQLELGQALHGDQVSQLLERKGFVVTLGGGHEIGWSSFLGAQNFLSGQNSSLGIINFDAHFDLRNPDPIASSGTPFRQCAEYCQEHNLPFNYCVFGLNPTANTTPLFDYAKSKEVLWLEDQYCHLGRLQQAFDMVDQFLQRVDYLYITLCMDVFNQAYAPGVSAPASIGVSPHWMLEVLNYIAERSQSENRPVLLMDVAEVNPEFDQENQTGKLAARIIRQVIDTRAVAESNS